MSYLNGTPDPSQGPTRPNVTMRYRPGPAAPRRMVVQVPAAGDGTTVRTHQSGVPRSASPGRRSDAVRIADADAVTENPYGNPAAALAYPGLVNTVPVNTGRAARPVRCRSETRRVCMAPGICGRALQWASTGPTIWGRWVRGSRQHPIAPDEQQQPQSVRCWVCGSRRNL